MVEKQNEPEAQQIISLRSLLTYDHPNREKLQKLIEDEHRSNPGRLPQRFSDQWHDYFYDLRDANHGQRPSRWEKLGSFLGQKIKGEILVDLGGGDSHTMHEMADILGVRTYINVDLGIKNDPNVGYSMPAGNYFKLPNEQRDEPLEAIEVYDDMLDFVSRLPDGSCNFTLNGIDDYVLKNSEYREALFRELIRATKVGGVIFGVESEVWGEDPQLKSVAKDLGLDTRSWGSRFEVLEKIKAE